MYVCMLHDQNLDKVWKHDYRGRWITKVKVKGLVKDVPLRSVRKITLKACLHIAMPQLAQVGALVGNTSPTGQQEVRSSQPD